MRTPNWIFDTCTVRRPFSDKSSLLKAFTQRRQEIGPPTGGRYKSKRRRGKLHRLCYALIHYCILQQSKERENESRPGSSHTGPASYFDATVFRQYGQWTADTHTSHSSKRCDWKLPHSLHTMNTDGMKKKTEQQKKKRIINRRRCSRKCTATYVGQEDQSET